MELQRVTAEPAVSRCLMPETLHVDWPDGAPLSAESQASLRRAASVLEAGGLVAIPTETVYGLAAVATDPAAVEAIFRAKGRPAGNPLIVHVADAAAAVPLVAEWPAAASRLAEEFWPGPLTMVLPRSSQIPDVVTAGGRTVALRSPAHHMTAELLRMLARPLAAPSANRSGQTSPTTAAHVAASLGASVSLILDGGPCERGIESTVIDLSMSPPRLLRPGPISQSQLEAVLGHVVMNGLSASTGDGPSSGPARSPGLLARHYAPLAEVELTDDAAEAVARRLSRGERVGWIDCGEAAPAEPTDLSGLLGVVTPISERERERLLLKRLPAEPVAYARALYATLHELDEAGVESIVITRPPQEASWLAIHDRLTRAACPRDEPA